MNTSQLGNQAFKTLNVRIDTLNKSDSGGRARYVYEEPYDVIRDDFQALAESSESTQDEKALARLGLLVNDQWLPGAGISKKEIFQAHAGLVNTAKEEYANPSGKNIGSVLAQATLSALDTAFAASPGMPFWTKDNMAASLLGAGFEAISESSANRKQKSLARKGLKTLEKFEYSGKLPTAEMEQIAGAQPRLSSNP